MLNAGWEILHAQSAECVDTHTNHLVMHVCWQPHGVIQKISCSQDA